MRKFSSAVLTRISSVVLSLPFVAAAQTNAPVNLPPSPVTDITGVAFYICKLLNWAFFFLILFAVVFAIIAAFGYLTSAGDPEKTKTAGKRLLYAAVAVIVAILAKGVPAVVGSFFGVPGLTSC